MRNRGKDKWFGLLQQIEDENKLREYLLQVEAEIKRIVGKDPLNFYMDNPSEEDINIIDGLIGDRKYILKRIFTYHEEEIKHIERVNDLLFSLTRQMYHRTANLYRALLKEGRDKAFDDDNMIEGTLDTGIEYDPDDGDFGTVLHMENDEAYGSDFSYMLYVIHENAKACRFCIDKIESCLISYSDSHCPEMTDKELECDYTLLDDGDSWNECLWEPQFKHICFCHAFHSLFTHQSYSLQDILRIDNFLVEAKIICQHVTDQKGRRFSEILNDK